MAVGLLAGLAAPFELDEADPVADERGERPDIVLVLTDDQRVETLRSMPAVRRLLVDKGTRFSHGMVPTALCCPSRASLLTGLFAHHTLVYGNATISDSKYGGYAQFHRRGLEYRTIATALDKAGYRTGLFGKYLNGFDNATPNGYLPPGWDAMVTYVNRRGAYFDYELTDGSVHGSAPEDYSTDVLAAKARRFVRQAGDGEPLFVMYAPYAPHAPFTPAPRYATAPVAVPRVRAVDPVAPDRPARTARTGRDGPGVVGGSAPGDVPRWAARRRTHEAALAPVVPTAQVRSLLAVDDAVASLVRTMRDAGRARDTLFVFTSDNGYLWGEHGMVGKDLPYDGATRVPLVLRWDGRVPAGAVDHRLALNVDLAGTIARAAGVAMRTDGIDLLGRRARKGFVLEAMGGYRKRPAYCGWRTRDWTYVRWATGRTELFDYRTKAGEGRNLAGKPRVRAIEARLQARAMRACRPEPPGFDW